MEFERAQSGLMVQSDVCAQQGTALLHTEVFSHVWETEISGSSSATSPPVLLKRDRIDGRRRWNEEQSL